jgi:hypothetical protein
MSSSLANEDKKCQLIAQYEVIEKLKAKRSGGESETRGVKARYVTSTMTRVTRAARRGRRKLHLLVHTSLTQLSSTHLAYQIYPEADNHGSQQKSPTRRGPLCQFPL